MKKTQLLLAAVTAFGLATSSAFTVLSGTVNEFTSPDDLLLDAATNVIAVNVVNGANPDLLVNGVLFQGDGGATAGTGTTVNGGVTVTTSRLSAPGGGEIPGWAAAPAFTGGTAGSASNLGAVMQSIRWAQGWAAGAPTGGGIDIAAAGLDPTLTYDVQLLFNEGGAATDRRFDISAEGALVVDDFSSQGGAGTWTPSNSFAYQGQFTPSADGILDFRLDPAIGGDPFMGVDGNPILQGVIIHEVIPEPSAPALLGLATAALVLRRRRRTS